ncbi:S49 family peptidase [Fibrella aquatica]|uniref:S49 family peptidase n=1 Tax=Fibrella aquatica TaxID=3242487 RepID=UPI003522F7E7
MAKYTLTLADLANQPWAIEPATGNALAMQLAHAPMALETPEEEPVIYEYSWVWYPKAQLPGSIAVIQIRGAIYDYYAQYICEKLDLIYRDKNVSGMLVILSSPGGQSMAGSRIADKLLAAPWNTACVIDYGMAASAGYAIGAACDGFYAGRASDMVGSIGTYITWQDFSGYFKKNGIVIKDLYADQSTEKNAEVRAAQEGNTEPLRAIATAEATRFIDYVKNRRPNLGKNASILKGAIFPADQGVKEGMLDGIASQKEIIAALRGTSASLTISSTRTDMFGFKKVPALEALSGLQGEQLTDGLLESANAELATLGVTGCALVTQAQFEAIASAPDPAALATANSEVTRLTTELNTAKSERDKAQSALETSQKEVTRLGSLNGAEPTTPSNAKDEQPDAEQAQPIKLSYTAESAGISHLID